MYKIEYENKKYVFYNNNWYDENNMKVPFVLEQKLNKINSKELQIEKINSFLCEEDNFYNISKYRPSIEKINYIFFYSYNEILENDSISKRIIDIFKKNYNIGDDINMYNSYQLFLNTFIKYFSKIYKIDLKQYIICVAPGSKCSKENKGNICIIAKDIAMKMQATEQVNTLLRYKTIKSHLEEGKQRTIKEHEQSICVNNNINVAGKKILILDDITVTGTTLMGCKKILLEAGAKEVMCFAFARKG